jgi:hypothetical protein
MCLNDDGHRVSVLLQLDLDKLAVLSFPSHTETGRGGTKKKWSSQQKYG